MRQITRTAGLAASVLATLALAAPAPAQFGGILGSRTRNAATASDACGPDQQGRSNAGSRIMGSILGGMAGDAARRAGIPYFVPVDEFADQLSGAIACRLDPEEQKQAADATLEATRGSEGDGRAEIGASAAWTSETRADVSGRSTVTARDESPADGLDCIVVTDVIIVQGEETRADKRMCRAPGSARYAIVA